MISQPLFTLKRGSFSEITIHGEICLFQNDKILFSTSKELRAYPARSLLKPFQFYACDLPQEKWQDDLRFTASLGSVSATEEQVSQIEAWYQDSSYEVLKQSLVYSLSYPMDEYHRAILKKNKSPLRPTFHTCFSKHMAILMSCQQNNWDLATYAKAEHPYHKRLMNRLEAILEKDLSQIECVTDGCLLPSPGLPLSDLAKLYSKLNSHDSTLSLITKKMKSSPQWIGGPSRSDTKLMELNPGRIAAKEGADGLFGFCDTERNIGGVIKLAPGFLTQYFHLALQPLLDSLEIKHSAKLLSGHTIEYHFKNI